MNATIGRRAASVVVAAGVLCAMAAALVVPQRASAAGCVSGTLIKGSLPAVYYCGADGKRYVFTNDKAFFTWYADFSSVTVLSDAELGAILIGGNVTYRPGKKMIKIQSDPKVYVISRGGTLRHVPNEACAASLYGGNWNQQIDDVSDAFFVNYTVGAAISACAEYRKDDEMAASQTINADRHIGPPGVSPIAVAWVTPANAATNVGLTSELSVRFTEPPLASSVSATGTFTLAMGSASGTPVAGTVSARGINVYFTPAAQLQANTTYTASLGTAVVDHQGEHMTAPYSWTFTTGAAGSGAVAPTVASVTPASGATNVAATTDVSATFSLAMDAASITASTFTLKKAGSSTSVAGTVSASGTTATLDPTTDLEAGASYTATLTTGVKSQTGVMLAADYSWSFTVAAASSGAITVTSISPPDGGTDVATSTPITATFSGSMDSSTIDATTFTVMKGAIAVVGQVSYSGNTATFTPGTELEADTTYTVTVTSGAKDPMGNSIAGGSFSWSFTTL